MGVELLGGRDISALCRTLNVRPSKKRGQNFVTDPGTVRRIAASAVGADGKGKTVLEIGPGLGSLTLALLETGAKVIAVEIDPRLAAALPDTCARQGASPGQLQVILSDALSISSAEDLLGRGGGEAPTVLAANLPYNVATPLLLHSLEVLPTVTRAVCMVQSEVADRWVAGTGAAAYGAPSAKLAWWGTSRRAFGVGRNVFYPPPNVDSAVVEFVRHQKPLFNSQLREVTFAAINAAFGQRRKTLRQSLSAWAGDTMQAQRLLCEAGIEPSLRAENLGVQQYADLAARIVAGSNLEVVSG